MNGGRTITSVITIAALGLALAPPARARAQAPPGRGCDPGAILARMTDAEKIGQLVMAVTEDGPDGMPSERTRRAVQDLKIGSVITSEPRTPGRTTRTRRRSRSRSRS
ncbi:hypothetical protein AB0C69_21855, partial [Actinomadura sp. NPDC048032]|uniref:hypothetical protein n=1 Tax=Actinomadura sp. NPDC048032 TaxID=3155747 RepID=UPI0033F5C438